MERHFQREPFQSQGVVPRDKIEIAVAHFQHGLEFCYIYSTMATVSSGRPHDMPTYEYSCTKCGQNFDAYQSMRDEPFKECPKELCRLEKWGHGKVVRLLGTGAGLIFKGSGFYTTDYRSKNYQEGAKKETPVSTAADSTSEKSSAKTDSAGAKPAAAAPPKASANNAKKEASK